MAEKDVKIEFIKPELINVAKYNPRDISEEAFKGLCESIKTFGMPQPLVINKTTNILVSGHQRLKAAMALKMKRVPCVFVELDDTKEKALNIALNNPSIQGHFTTELKDILMELQEPMGDLFIDLKMDDLMPKMVDDFMPNIDIDSEEGAKKYLVTVTLQDEEQQENLFHELNSKGYKVKVNR